MDIFFENRQKDRSSVTARKTNREKSARKTITNLGACETFGAMRFDNWRLENLRQTVRDRGSYRRRRQIASYGDSCLDFEFVYYVTGADYAKYMDIQQAINLSVFETFEWEKIEFAYPSQTLFVNQAN